MIEQLQTTPFDHLLVTGAGWLLLLCAGWSLLICLAAVIEAATAGRLRVTAWLGCPTRVRRVLLAVLGVTLAAAPAQAVAAAGAGRCAGASIATQGTLPVPARPIGSSRERRDASVMVRRGDSLWGIARTHLSPSASSDEVADLVAGVHRRNRLAIGPDPDLIHPGERLSLPTRPRHPEDAP